MGIREAMSELMQALQAKVKAVHAHLADVMQDDSETPQHDHEKTNDAVDSEGQIDADAHQEEVTTDDGHPVSDDDKLVEADLTSGVMVLNEYQNYQRMCKDLQLTAQKLIPTDKIDAGLNCYMDYDEKKAVMDSYEKLEKMGEALLKTASTPVDL